MNAKYLTNWAISIFSQNICLNASKVIESISIRVEDAVFDLLELLKGSYERLNEPVDPAMNMHVPKTRVDESETDENATEVDEKNMKEALEDKAWKEKIAHRNAELEEEARELIMFFNHKLVDALLKCIRHSLDSVKKRVFPA